MTFNTGNPVGSTDARDLYDNAQNLDKFSLGQELEYPDRLGVPRKSLAGIRAEVTEALSRLGYQVIGDYAAGLVAQNFGQVFRKDGEFYRASASLDLPYTLTGNWATESVNFVSVGDAVLRQELANGTSAPVDSNVVGYRDRTVRAKLDEAVSVKDFGAVGDGVADDTAALQAARDYAAAKLAAGNAVEVVFPAGRYLCTASPNWAISRLHLRAAGEVWLINEGAGSSFELDGGASGAGVYGMVISGDFNIYGDAGSGHGVYWRAVHRSDVSINVRGAGPAYSGLYMEWGVSNTLRFVMTTNEGGLYSTPARCMTLTQRAINEQSSYNTFLNGEWAGAPIGAYLDAALGNLFIGGAFQANTQYGAQLTVNSWNNKFVGSDFEVNTTADIVDDGRNNQFVSCDTEKLIHVTAGALNGAIFGGEHESITIDAGAARTRVLGVTYSRFGAGVLTDNGTKTRLRDNVNKASGDVENTPRARTTLTVGASPYTYANSTGGEVDVAVLGGTVSELVFTRFAGDAIPYAAASGAMLRLSPDDSITVTYTAAPTMIAYTR